MKRFASHYVFLPENGFLKQYVVEMEEGIVVRLFPLTEEIESVEWLPGVIVLLPNIVNKESRYLSERISELFQKDNGILTDTPLSYTGDLSRLCLSACSLFPFDFTLMLPVSGTQRRLLP